MLKISTDERLAVQLLSSSRRSFPCPCGESKKNLACLKIFNPDPRASWDFFFLQIRQVVGDSSQVSLFIPLAGGGLRRITSRVSSKKLVRITSLESYEAETLSAGFAHLALIEVRRFYEEARAHLYVTRTRIQDFDAGGQPVGESKPIAAEDWPPLPGEAAISDLLLDLEPETPQRSRALRHLSAGVSFPSVKDLDNGDYEVADGSIQVGAGRADLLGLEHGIRIYSSFQEGFPTLITNDYYLITNGRIRRLFGERCAQRVARQLIEIYKKRDKNGLFRAKSKLSHIRSELRVEETIWEDT